MTYLHSEGYRVISGDRYEHRVVMEAKIGRPLRSSEYVHHINGDKLDNRPGNLEILGHSDHQVLHTSKSVLSNDNVRVLLRLGWSYRELAKENVWQHRVARLRREMGLAKP